MDNYLVTGGLGFIGTNYVKELIKKENKVIILDSIEYAGNPDNFKGYKIYCKDNKKIFNLGEYTVKRIKRWEKRIRLEKIDTISSFFTPVQSFNDILSGGTGVL